MLKRFIWLLPLALTALGLDVPSISDADFIKAAVDAHNGIRSNVTPTAANMKYMSWDSSLAKTAKAWSSFCKFQHNIYISSNRLIHPTFFPIGENLYAGGTFNMHQVVNLWASEVNNYNNENQTCKTGKVCGHYTQVIWSNSYKVGCAVSRCPGTYGYIVLCNYGPAGNYRGSKPYTIGLPCSECSDDICVNNLCTNQKRDRVVEDGMAELIPSSIF
ncbi:GLIPR1-like protein 1 [Spea bombifrons]|uniref:GLIPR1-like protein 1 n=1 Tax=Spea bombifrons TaxID=233779 RepID=UPI0023494CCF|nr:GLIPR1-like protein 1 [Spea bombifrons]